MGMPCEVNSILKLGRSQGFPDSLRLHEVHQVTKLGYRIIPLDVPLPLVDDTWHSPADIIIQRLTWENQTTSITFEVVKIHPSPLNLK